MLLPLYYGLMLQSVKVTNLEWFGLFVVIFFWSISHRKCQQHLNIILTPFIHNENLSSHMTFTILTSLFLQLSFGWQRKCNTSRKNLYISRFSRIDLYRIYLHNHLRLYPKTHKQTKCVFVFCSVWLFIINSSSYHCRCCHRMIW